NLVKQIHAIVDGKAVVISESSVRNNLLFNDEDGITCLTNDEIFENLALMGQSKGFSGKVTPFFDSILVQNQAPNGEGSAIPPEPQPTPSISQPNVSEPQTAPLQTKTPLTVSHEPQTEAHINVPLDLGADEAVHKEGTIAMANVDIPQGMDTGGSLRRQETIGGAPAQTRSERVLEKPNEAPLPEGQHGTYF
ncbi:hypothetical protein Tco_1298672, partial [Tanacetum coccineum]